MLLSDAVVFKEQKLSTITLQTNPHNRDEEIQSMNRGSYMSAHVLLNLLNEFEKRDKMRGVSSILSSSQ